MESIPTVGTTVDGVLQILIQIMASTFFSAVDIRQPPIRNYSLHSLVARSRLPPAAPQQHLVREKMGAGSTALGEGEDGSRVNSTW
jgi:hypothetical protein